MDKYKIIQILEDLVATVDHGECFYDDQEFDDYLVDIEKLKRLSKQLFYKNTEE
ncbi:hypothetical protein SALINJAH_125 [Bacillus phage SalinJah]|uniref:Uncharacterized protein n=1 Tax=Bacillus phage SalinJah TaxID=1837830 RepID=A0A173GB89_9CAUD|nr:hypothetical protein SALINJAH_125 [Bacillus phage SalinJah]ANH50592.1 hypothetical protein SALINJAH_125 [Bacillus phage SalinJah]